MVALFFIIKKESAYLPFRNPFFSQWQKSMKMLFWIPTLIKFLVKKKSRFKYFQFHMLNHWREWERDNQDNSHCILLGEHQQCNKDGLQKNNKTTRFSQIYNSKQSPGTHSEKKGKKCIYKWKKKPGILSYKGKEQFIKQTISLSNGQCLFGFLEWATSNLGQPT